MRVEVKHRYGQSDPQVYLDPTGEISHFPRSLSLLVGPLYLVFN